MSAPPANRENRFDWPVCQEAEDFLLAQIELFLTRNAFARQLADRMTSDTGTLLLDWVDYIVLSQNHGPVLTTLGFVPDTTAETPPEHAAWHHPEAMLPRIILEEGHDRYPNALAIHVESLPHFMAVHAVSREIEGPPLSRFRRALISDEHGTCFYAVERRGYRGFLPDPHHADATTASLLQAMELWQIRQRCFASAEDGYQLTFALLDEIIAMVGRDLACHLVFAGERDYWQRRNRAAQVQKNRQDRLGLGWANHDHHTFRSSRSQFVNLMRVMEKLGFERRERYYAGDQAGWGAQILEQPVEGIVSFCDVDLRPEDTEIDFSRQPLPPQPSLGTIGLWTGLHGESFLESGMHHLECRFDHALLRDQLAGVGINTMKPFSDLPFLKQAFTEGERWQVRPERVQALLDHGSIDAGQASRFLSDGAIGSHLENLQRKGGFKGFNQKSVSAIIAAVDPRKMVSTA